MRCLWQVEVKEWRREKLARHWPHVPRRGDIRLVAGADLAPVDLICGGFPCQDISAAGKGAGISGRRSGLWSEMYRLVREVGPRWVLAENVPPLRTRGADRVLADLEEAGYACEPIVVGAWAVGAPHRRDRVWLVGHANDAGLEGWGLRGRERADERAAGPTGSTGLAYSDGGDLWDESGRSSGASGAGEAVAGDDGRVAHSGDLGPERPSRSELEEGWITRAQPTCVGLGDPPSERRREAGCSCDDPSYWPARPGEHQHEWEAPRTTQPGMGRSTHGLSRRMALAALGDAVVPQVVEMIGRAILEIERRRIG